MRLTISFLQRCSSSPIRDPAQCYARWLHRRPKTVKAIRVHLQGLLTKVLLKGVVRIILSNVPGSQEYDRISRMEIEILRLAQLEPTKAYLPSSIASAAHSEPVQSTEWS